MGGVQYMRGVIFMKAHSPVSAGKVSAGKLAKKFQCGKCKKSFPKGRGHNARTCGKNTQHGSGTISTTNVSPRTPTTRAESTPSISEIDTLLQRKLKKGGKVPQKPQRTVDEDGTVVWTLDGKLHNPDGPAVEHVDGYKEWWVHGERHNPDGPAIEHADGYKEWRIHGKLHRNDGPAREYADGNKEWYSHGKLHRDDGPAVEHADGYKEWWVDGKLHRLDGPAIEWSGGGKAWWVDGLDGPAIEWSGGGKAWWVDGFGTKHPDLCEKAVLPDLTDEEFYELCTHEDYVVRQLATHNPRCPAEWRTLGEIMYG